MKQKVFYFFSAFVCGAAVMAVEMSGTRLLAPYFGTSLFVWTNVIAVILVAMAFGYSLGGRLADRDPRAEPFFFWIAVTGAWTVAIPFLAVYLLPRLSSGLGSLEASLRWGSLMAVLLLFAFPMVLLGMVTPFTVRLTADKIQHVGSLAGHVSMISTVGSLVGTFLPAFVLIPELGTTKTFLFVGISLILLAGFGLRNWFFVLVAVAACGLFWWVPPVYAAADVVATIESPYSYLFVTQNAEGVRYLHMDNDLGVQSVYDPKHVLTSSSFYYGYFGVLPAMLDEPHHVLILGHAAGSFTRIFNTYYPELEVTGVELDPAVTQMAQREMGLLDAQVNIVHADARQYLLNSDEQYDLILIDTYHGPNIPAHLMTAEFFELVHEHVALGGMVALNAAATPGDFLDHLTNSMAEPFESAFSFSVPGSFNTMLLARDGLNYEAHSVPADLQNYWNAIRATAAIGLRFYDPDDAVFHDEKLSQAELENEEMFMQLLSRFR